MFPTSFFVLGLSLSALLAWAFSWGGHRTLTALGVGAGCAIGLIAAGGWLGLPPSEAWGVVSIAAIAGAVLGLIEGVAPVVVTWGLRFLVVQAVVGLVLRPLTPDTFSIDTAALRWSGLSAAAFLVWWHLDRLGERLQGAAWPIAWWMIGVGTAVVLVMGGSLRLGQLGMVTASVLTGLVLGSLPKRNRTMGAGPLASIVLSWLGLLLNGTFYNEVPEASVALLACAPCACWVGCLGQGWKPKLAMTAALTVVIGAAIVFAAI